MYGGRIVFQPDGLAQYEEFAVDIPLGQDDILIRTEFSVTSTGTELAKLTGLQQVAYPFVPGNRAAGVVTSVGSAVKNISPGDYVFSHTPHASFTKAEKFCFRVPADVKRETAPFIGLALVAITAIRVGKPELGDRAVVLGLGAVGNICAQLLALAGVDVLGVDLLDGRLQIARACGIANVCNPASSDIAEAVRDFTGGNGAEYVIETTGNPAVIETACALARREGYLILLGSPRGQHVADITPFLNHVHLWHNRGSITVIGAHEWRYPISTGAWHKHSMERNAAIISSYLADGRLRTAPLVGATLPPQQATEAYHRLQQEKESCLTILFDWRGLR